MYGKKIPDIKMRTEYLYQENYMESRCGINSLFIEIKQSFIDINKSIYKIWRMFQFSDTNIA